MVEAVFNEQQNIRKTLYVQCCVVVLLGAIFSFRALSLGASALAGGLAAGVPQLLFWWCLQRQRHSEQENATGRIAWWFFAGEIVKVSVTVGMLLVAKIVFNAALFPLLCTWLAVLIVQFVALLVPSKRR